MTVVVAVSGQRPDVPMSARLWIALPVATMGIYAVWGGLMTMLIARQIAEMVPDPRTSAGLLGAVMALGASVALVAQPILGSLSDRTAPGQLGRRNRWILWGSLGAALVLAAMTFATTVPVLAILFAIVVLVLSGAHAALSTVLPERVPYRLQGKMSGICGAATMLGLLIGVAVTGFMPDTRMGYLALAAIVAPVGAGFALMTPDRDNAVSANAPPPSGWLSLFHNLPGLTAHRDYWLTFLSRFALLMGYNVLIGFNLYLLRDHMGFGSGDVVLVAREATKVMTVSTTMLLVFSLLGGVACDIWGRVRGFVIGAAVALIPVSIFFALVASLTGYYIAQAAAGAIFGLYMAVDAVLIARVLPSTGNTARDLGVLNVANSGPQALAPMVAGAIIAATGNYVALFALVGVMALVSALAACGIRGVK